MISPWHQGSFCISLLGQRSWGFVVVGLLLLLFFVCVCVWFVVFVCAFFVVFFVVVVWGWGGQKSTQSLLCNPVVPAAFSLFEFPPPRPLFLNPSWPLSCKPPSWIFSLTELSACFPSQVTWLRSARRACPCGPRPTTLPSLTAASPSTTWLRTQSTNSASLPQMLLALANSVCPVLQSKSKRNLVSKMVVHASVCLPSWGLPPLEVFASLSGLSAFLLIWNFCGGIFCFFWGVGGGGCGGGGGLCVFWDQFWGMFHTAVEQNQVQLGAREC